MTNKPPPHSMSVERSVLGSLLVVPDIIGSTIEKLPVTAFYGTQNQKVYSAIVDIYDNEGTPDLVSLCEYLRRKSILDECGGEGYLSELVEDIDTSPNIKSWIDILLTHTTKRKIIQDCIVIQQQAYQIEIEPSIIVDQLVTASESILEFCEDHGVKHRKRGRVITIEDVWGETKDFHRNGIEKLGTPITDWPMFSEKYRVNKGLLTVITGIPTHGKTTFLDQIITDTVINHNFKWAIFSPENKPYYLHIKPMAEKIANKRFFGESGICDGELEFIKDKLKNNIFFVEPNSNNLSISEIKRLFKVSIEKYGVDAVVIDPWNKITHEYKGRETSYIGTELTKCQILARDYNVAFHIVAHPQKMRKLPGATVYEVPTAYDIDGSANWYNMSDEILSIHRNFEKDYVEAHHQKVKFTIHGKLGVGYFRYNSDTTKLDEITLEQAKSGNNFEEF